MSQLCDELIGYFYPYHTFDIHPCYCMYDSHLLIAIKSSCESTDPISNVETQNSRLYAAPGFDENYDESSIKYSPLNWESFSKIYLNDRM